jgi:hypothetical protein
MTTLFSQSLSLSKLRQSDSNNQPLKDVASFLPLCYHRWHAKEQLLAIIYPGTNSQLQCSNQQSQEDKFYHYAATAGMQNKNFVPNFSHSTKLRWQDSNPQPWEDETSVLPLFYKCWHEK